jgi:hypothetical protein
VSATVFIANRRSDRPRRRAARSVFCAREVEGLPEDLDFHGLAPEQALQVPHAPLQLAHPAGADDLLIGLHGLMAAL